MKSKGRKRRVLALLLCYLLSVIILSLGAFAQGNPKIITHANITVTLPVGGETPDYNPKSTEPGKYTIIMTFWELNESPWSEILEGEPFQPGKEYSLRVFLEAVNGYTFSEDCVYTISGKNTKIIQDYDPSYAGIQLKTIAKLKAVTSLQATSIKNNIKVSWNPSQGSTGYLIYRRAPGETKMTYRGAQTTTVFSETVSKEGNYYYRVFPYVKYDDKVIRGESDQYVRTYVSFKPSPVQNLKAQGKGSYILLSWSPASNKDGYVVYRKAPGESTLSYHRTLTSAATSYKDTRITAPGYYFYRVYAYTTIQGKRLLSPSNSYVFAEATLEPAAVANLRAKLAGSKAIGLNWSPSVDAQGYIIYRRAPGESKLSYRWIVSKGTTSFVDKQVSKGTYFYRVYPYISYKGKKIIGKSLNYSYCLVP